MRLWSIHPRYLDPPGLGGQWREAVLAQYIVEGRTSAYRRHPQVRRVLEHPDPWGAIHDYLVGIWEEGRRRGYHYDRSKIREHKGSNPLDVPRGQLEYELALLRIKLESRDPARALSLPCPERAEPHPSIRVVEGGLADWERPRADVLERLEQCRFGRSP